MKTAKIAFVLVLLAVHFERTQTSRISLPGHVAEATKEGSLSPPKKSSGGAEHLENGFFCAAGDFDSATTVGDSVYSLQISSSPLLVEPSSDPHSLNELDQSEKATYCGTELPDGTDPSTSGASTSTMLTISFAMLRIAVALRGASDRAGWEFMWKGFAVACLTRCVADGVLIPSTPADILSLAWIAGREFLHAYGLFVVLNFFPVCC